MSEEYDTKNRGCVICPYCGYSYDWFKSERIIDGGMIEEGKSSCEKCKKTFLFKSEVEEIVNVEYHYWTYKISKYCDHKKTRLEGDEEKTRLCLECGKKEYLGTPLPGM